MQSDLLESIDRTEPRNASVYFETAQPLARLAGKASTAVISKTLTLVDRACKLAPGDARYIAEYGYQQLLLGEAAGALRTYRRASQLDEMNMDAVYGSLFCQVHPVCEMKGILLFPRYAPCFRYFHKRTWKLPV